MKDKTISNYVESLKNKYGNQSALIYKKTFRTEEWSYSDIYNFAHKITGLFKENKLKKGDKIIIYCYNCPEWGSIFLACALSGIIAVPIDFNSKINFVKKIIKKVDSKMIFSSKYRSINSKSKEIFVEELITKIKKYHSYKCKALINEEDIVEIIYTSGTTSDPKGVMITNKNLISNIHSLKLHMQFKKKLVFLSIVPLSHLLEQTLGFFIPLRFGFKIVYSNSLKSSTILKVMNDEKIHSMVSVPILLKTLKDKIEREIEKEGKINSFRKILKISEKLPLFIRRILFKKIINKLSPNLKFFIVGGAALDKNVEQFWNSLGVLILQGYGLTETSPIISCNTFKHNKKGTVGRILPNQKIKILEDGEIISKGDNITRGYFNNKELTKKSIRNGWFYTGDMGEVDKEGFLIIKGRKKNMILTSSGLNVYPEDIEKLLNKEINIKDSIVLGIKQKNEIVINAIIIPIKNKKINTSKLINRINSQLSSHQQIQRLVIWKDDDFPRTSTLKIKRREIEKCLKNNNEKKNKKDIPTNKIFKIVADVSNNKISKIKSNSILSTDLAMDSLNRVELLSMIEEEYNVEIEEDKITEKTTVNQLLNLITNTSEVKNITKLSKINTSKWIKFIRFFLQLLLFFILKIFYRIKVSGLENLKNIRGPVIFAINHTSHLDTPTLLRTLPIRIRLNIAFAAAQDYFFIKKEDKNNILKKLKVMFLQILLNIYPFSREGNIKQSLKITGNLLDKGISIGIYPEGTRSTSGEIGVFKTGIGLIAANMDVPIIPVKIKGLFKILPKGETCPKFGNVKVYYGEPIKIDKDTSYIDIAKTIEMSVKRL